MLPKQRPAEVGFLLRLCRKRVVLGLVVIVLFRGFCRTVEFVSRVNTTDLPPNSQKDTHQPRPIKLPIPIRSIGLLGIRLQTLALSTCPEGEDGWGAAEAS